MSETMVTRVARAIKAAQHPNSDIDEYETARAALEAMKDPPFDILGAMFEAMFEDKWNGSQAPMIGAGWDAGIDAALNEHANAR
jgi:hypothetical protein